MHVVNIMFSSIAGGIEQAFVDYCEGLKNRGHRITAITHPNAAVNPQLEAIGITPLTLRNFGAWDMLAIWRLRRMLQFLAPDIAIAHTTRSYTLARRAIGKSCPLVATAHNYNKRIGLMKTADAVFTTTHDLIDFVGQQGMDAKKIFHIPNMVRCHELPQRSGRNNPPVIGTMGRFVKKKGFDIYIDALRILKERGYKFKAILGGDGEENKALRQRAADVGIMDVLSFPGWIDDKKAFYTGIDIFCLPSLHEPFGIVLLEAFVFGTPVVATDSEGPRDIITPNFDALIVKKDNASELAAALARLLDDAPLAAALAANAFVKAKSHYSIESVSEKIEKALLAIATK